MPGEPEFPPPSRRPAARLRRLDRRTIAISVLVAIIVALGAGLLASILTDDGSSSSNAAGSNGLRLTPAHKVDTAKALHTRLLSFDGRTTTLAARIGERKPAVVNFFSSTCAPCVAEMAAFERVHRSSRDVTFVGIDVQDGVAAGRKLIKRTGITYEALRDPPGDLLMKIGGVGLPTTVLIDAQGRVVATHTGALTERTLGALIHSKLG